MMEDTRVLTLEALDEFIATQSGLLERTLGDIDRLRELKSRVVQDQLLDLDTLAEQLDDPAFRLSERAEECRMKIPKGIDWGVFDGCDPAPLHRLTLQSQHLYAQRNIPATTQQTPLSELQVLVKSARQHIVDPVLAVFADMSDVESSDEEDPEERAREREREKIRELKKRKIRGWGGLSLPSSIVRGEGGEGVFIRRDVDDESMDVDIGEGDGHEPSCTPGLMPPPPVPPQVSRSAPRPRKPSKKAAKLPSSSEEEQDDRPPKKLKPSTTKEKKKKGKEKPKPETYKQAWSVSEQHLLEQLLEQIPEGERFRWQKISRAMNGTRTPRQVASRVQKYFEKLKRFGIDAV